MEDPRIVQLQEQLVRLTAELKEALMQPEVDPENDPEVQITQLNAQIKRLTDAKQSAVRR